MLALDGVSKSYDLLPILDNVTLVLEPGTRHVLCAPNGSGKTTLLRIMAGLTRPTRGRVLWNGAPLSARDRRHLGVVLEQPLLHPDLTGLENLCVFAALYGCRPIMKVASAWLEAAGLGHAAHQRVREYSKGMRQRLALARALLHQPSVLLLDEPFDGLDAKGRAWAHASISAAVAAGAAVFLVTHREWEAGTADVRWTLRFGRLVSEGGTG